MKRDLVIAIVGALVGAIAGSLVTASMSENAAFEAETRHDIKNLIASVASIETAQAALEENLRETKTRVDHLASEVRLRASPDR
ncbi:MAG: hypothetical protein OXI90_17465 [Gammaproteobacteria bacterium]|nr:hypothetical protein [Gammaproteobacteria bacterium]